MNLPFDIFELVPGDRVIWRGTAGTIEEARAHVQKLASDSPGRYLILRLQTGDGLVVDSDGTDELDSQASTEDESLESV
jgi:hypothetical protein